MPEVAGFFLLAEFFFQIFSSDAFVFTLFDQLTTSESIINSFNKGEDFAD